MRIFIFLIMLMTFLRTSFAETLPSVTSKVFSVIRPCLDQNIKKCYESNLSRNITNFDIIDCLSLSSFEDEIYSAPSRETLKRLQAQCISKNARIVLKSKENQDLHSVTQNVYYCHSEFKDNKHAKKICKNFKKNVKGLIISKINEGSRSVKDCTSLKFFDPLRILKSDNNKVYIKECIDRYLEDNNITNTEIFNESIGLKKFLESISMICEDTFKSVSLKIKQTCKKVENDFKKKVRLSKHNFNKFCKPEKLLNKYMFRPYFDICLKRYIDLVSKNNKFKDNHTILFAKYCLANSQNSALIKGKCFFNFLDHYENFIYDHRISSSFFDVFGNLKILINACSSYTGNYKKQNFLRLCYNKFKDIISCESYDVNDCDGFFKNNDNQVYYDLCRKYQGHHQSVECHLKTKEMAKRYSWPGANKDAMIELFPPESIIHD